MLNIIGFEPYKTYEFLYTVEMKFCTKNLQKNENVPIDELAIILKIPPNMNKYNQNFWQNILTKINIKKFSYYMAMTCTEILIHLEQNSDISPY